MIRLKVKRNSWVRSKMRNFYEESLRIFHKEHLDATQYPKAKLYANIKFATDFPDQINELSLKEPIFDAWKMEGLKVWYYRHWYHAIKIGRDIQNNIIGLICDSCYEGSYYIPKQNESSMSNSIKLTKPAFHGIINECVRQVLTEVTPYKPVAHNRTITLDNGVKTKSLVTLSNGFGGKYEIYENDGCYVIWDRGWKGESNHWHIFPELHDALKKLPTLPLP